MPFCLVTNVVAVLRHYAFAPKVRYNALRGVIEIDKEGLSNTAISSIRLMLQETWKFEPTRQMVMDAVEFVANTEGWYDPVQEYLKALPAWDGVPRTDTWLIDFAGAEDSAYTRAVSRKTLVGAVLRAMQPGGKFDHMLILEGVQDLGKSQLVAALVPDDQWFGELTLNLAHGDTDKDAQRIQGKWLVELPELTGMSRADVNAMKTFINRRVDRFRKPWAIDAADFPRRNVFIGTTNETEYMKDTTGNRRYWPVEVEFCDPEGIKTIRDQLWAEAYAYYILGEKVWIDDPDIKAEAKQEQERRRDTDPWEEDLERYIDDTGAEMLSHAEVYGALGYVDTRHLNMQTKRRVLSCMDALGWVKRRKKGVLVDGKVRYDMWVKPGFRQAKDSE